MAITGDTIYLNVEFKTINNVYADPTEIKLNVYAFNKLQLGTSVTVDENYKTSTGKYTVPYTIPASQRQDCIYVEFSGILDGYKILGRKKVGLLWNV